MLAKHYAFRLPKQHSVALASELKNWASTWSACVHAHAVLARSYALNSPIRHSAADANAVNISYSFPSLPQHATPWAVLASDRAFISPAKAVRTVCCTSSFISPDLRHIFANPAGSLTSWWSQQAARWTLFESIIFCSVRAKQHRNLIVLLRQEYAARWGRSWICDISNVKACMTPSVVIFPRIELHWSQQNNVNPLSWDV